jgi:hypothetical protein
VFFETPPTNQGCGFWSELCHERRYLSRVPGRFAAQYTENLLAGFILQREATKERQEFGNPVEIVYQAMKNILL